MRVNGCPLLTTWSYFVQHHSFDMDELLLLHLLVPWKSLPCTTVKAWWEVAWRSSSSIEYLFALWNNSSIDIGGSKDIELKKKCSERLLSWLPTWLYPCLLHLNKEWHFWIVSWNFWSTLPVPFLHGRWLLHSTFF